LARKKSRIKQQSAIDPLQTVGQEWVPVKKKDLTKRLLADGGKDRTWVPSKNGGT